jgi:hypothetical protein
VSWSSAARDPPPMTPGPEPGQVLGLRLPEGFPTDLLQVGEELVRGALLGHDGRFGVPPPPAHREVLVPGRPETRWTALNRRRCRLPHLRDTPSQGLHQQEQRPACELSPSGTGSRRPASLDPDRSAMKSRQSTSVGTARPRASRNPANALNSASWRLIVASTDPPPSTRRSPAPTRREPLLPA